MLWKSLADFDSLGSWCALKLWCGLASLHWWWSCGKHFPFWPRGGPKPIQFSQRHHYMTNWTKQCKASKAKSVSWSEQTNNSKKKMKCFDHNLVKSTRYIRYKLLWIWLSQWYMSPTTVHVIILILVAGLSKTMVGNQCSHAFCAARKRLRSLNNWLCSKWSKCPNSKGQDSLDRVLTALAQKMPHTVHHLHHLLHLLPGAKTSKSSTYR